MRRRTFLATIAAAGLGWRGACARSDFPDHTVTLIVPFDLPTHVGRTAIALRPHLEAALHQRIELQFKPSADGELGHRLGADAPADGYTLTMVSQSLTAQPWLTVGSVATPDNFAFIGQITSVPNLLVVRADSPYLTLAQLVIAMRSAPNGVATGGQPNWWPAAAVARALFTALAGVQPAISEGYYSGSAEVGALRAGQLDFAVVSVNDLHGSLAALRLRALAVASTHRLPAMPDTPTFREQGWDITTSWWHGLAAPKATQAGILATLQSALESTLASSLLQADFAREGLTVDPLDAATMTRQVTNEYQVIGELFTQLGKNRRIHRPT